MKLNDFYTKRIGKKTIVLSLLFFIVMALVAVNIYLNKMDRAIKQEFVLIQNVEQKLKKIDELERTIEKIELPQMNNPEYHLAVFMDELKAKFPEINAEPSQIKKESDQFTVNIGFKGDAVSSRFERFLSFLEENRYPVIFVNNVNLEPKDNRLNFNIKAELKGVIQENVQGI